MHTSYLVHSGNRNAVFANLGVRAVKIHTVVKYKIMCNSDYKDKKRTMHLTRKKMKIKKQM